MQMHVHLFKVFEVGALDTLMPCYQVNTHKFDLFALRHQKGHPMQNTSPKPRMVKKSETPAPSAQPPTKV